MAPDLAWRIRLDLAEPDVVVAVGISLGGEEIGFASAGPTRDTDLDDRWELYALNVVAAARGSGLAGDLVAATVGDRASSVWVLAGNERALAFYAREGWVADRAERTHAGSGLPEVRLLRPRGSLHGGPR